MKKRMEENLSNARSAAETETSLNTDNNNESIISTPLPAKTKLKVPKSTRVKVGHKNTEAINSKYIKTVADWVSYSDRTNVRLGSDGTLNVIGDDGNIKTIPFQKGFDAVRGITMRSELLRKKSIDHLSMLRTIKKTNLSRLHAQFVEKESELLAATRTFRESVSDGDGSLAANVVRLNKELSEISSLIQEAKYEEQSAVYSVLYPRAQIQPETHDDRVVEVFESTKLETTIASRTLGLDGEPLKEPEVSNDVNDDDENEPAPSNDSGSNESAPSNDSGSNESASPSVSHDYFQELVDEIKSKLETFTPPPSMTIRELKAAIFTEERLSYYDTHIPDFKKQFTQAYLKAIGQ